MRHDLIDEYRLYLELRRLRHFGMVPRAESNLPTPAFSSAALYRVSYLGACPTQLSGRAPAGKPHEGQKPAREQ